MKVEEFTLMYPARIIFGRGVIEQLAEETLFFGKKALLVTGRSAMRKMGVEKTENLPFFLQFSPTIRTE